MPDHQDRDLRRFRRILRLYPAAYRRQYGEEIEAFFLRERKEGGRGTRFWLRQWLDHAAAAVCAEDMVVKQHAAIIF